MIQCKGRNGYFQYDNNQVSSLGQEILIQINSKRACYRNLAPILFQGTRQEIKTLLTEMLQKVRAA